MQNLHWADIVTIGLYFVLCLGVGIWSSCKTNTGSVKGYFLAGRNMIWLPVGASFFSTNVGSQKFIGMAGSAAANGIAVIAYEWHAIYIFMLLGWIFIPVYAASGCYTMPEYLKKRFGGRRLRMTMACVGILKFVLNDVSTLIFAGTLFIEQSVGWDMYSSITIVIVITTIYTIIGGLSAVIWADTVQTVILLIGSTYMTIHAFTKVGGYQALQEKYFEALPNVSTCGNVTAGYPRADSFEIFRDPVTGDIPWPGLIFGLTPMAIFAWCADQVTIQRLLAAKTQSHAKGGILFAGYLKLLPLFMVIFPGMISRVLYPDEVGCVDPEICQSVCGDANGCSNIAYPLLVLRILPAGVRGLLLAVMLSALMSTLTSIFNSASTVFTLDLYIKFRPLASRRELMIVSRVFIGIIMCISIAYIPILKEAQGGQLWNYLQAVQAYLVPQWCMIFLLGIAWTRTSEQGAFWGLMAGLVTGFTRMVIDLSYPKPACGEPETRPPVLFKVHFLYFSIIVSVVTFTVCVVVSLLTPPRPKEKLNRVTWSTRNSVDPRLESDDEDDPDEKDDEMMSGDDNKLEMENENENDKLEENEDYTSLRHRIYNIICCFSSFKTRHKTREMLEEERRVYNGDYEPKWVKKFLNLNAILLVAFVSFLFGFFH